MNKSYREKVQQQIEQYRGLDINVLPPIFHHWSHTYLRPLVEEVFGHSSFADVYADQFRKAFGATGNRRVASLGSGDAWMEVEIAQTLRKWGESDFVIECVELSDHLIQRGQARARQAGVEQHILFRQVDLNSWQPENRMAAFMANQALHHFVELERIFDFIKNNLDKGGVFVTNDTIGRNGHMRWPETRLHVQALWDQLPERFKYHHQLQRFESPDFIDWDCSVEGFEGIRAQDIMPELLKRFGFTYFAAWGGIIDIFTDRGFGHNYSADDPKHLAFIDHVEKLNASLLQCGLIKPTQMLAVMTNDRDAVCRTHNGLTPQLALRDPKGAPMLLD